MEESEGDVLLFNPATEFQVLEEFEFDELIQRPEEIRFFTLNAQTTDFFEKLLPKTGKLTKGAIRKAEYEVDTFKKLYDRIVGETPDGFEIRTTTRPQTLPWVTYTNSGSRQTSVFRWQDEWTPLFEDGAGMRANYYVQMLDSLPKRAIYYDAEGGQAVTPARINDTIALEPIRYTKTAYREDGTFRIQSITRPDTGDRAAFTGYTIDVPSPAPPNPLEGHPFLGSRAVPVTLETTEDLPTILPSLEAIFTHAVPRTSNPYKDAPPYLKLYDIRLSQVPWKEWKTAFPPAELVEEGAPPTEIPLKEGGGDAPSKILTDVYGATWHPGLSTRGWLGQQLDGGVLVSRILLSQAGTHGPLAIPPPVVLPDSVPIEGTAEDCLPSTITEFADFASRGIYRTPRCAVCGWYGHTATDCGDRKGKVVAETKPGGGCIPLPQVMKEREEAPFQGKQPWNPETEAAILAAYQTLIKKHTVRDVDIVTPPSPEAPAPAPIPEARELILAILRDESRVPEDKAVAIQAILNTIEYEILDDLYVVNKNQFLICQHTIEQLLGDYERNPDAFLLKWTAKDDGFRTCKACGERVTEIIEAQDQFDENGRLIQSQSKLGKPAFVNEEHVTFAASLQKLQSLFKTESPAEDIFYLLLSLLQVLPDTDQLLPVLGVVRSESSKMISRIAGKKLTPKQQSDVDMALAVFGFNGVVILLQTHKPQLLPRRSFGSKPLVLRGFPRDTTDASDAPLIDSLLGALQQTFEAYPSTFRGASVVLLRNILNDRKKVRSVILSSMTKQFVPLFQDALRTAKETQAPVDVVQPPVNAFHPPLYRPGKEVTYLSPADTIATGPERRFRCKDPSPPWLIPSTPFSFRQAELTITSPLRPSSKATEIAPPTEFPEEYTPTKEEVRQRLRIDPAEFRPLRRVLDSGQPDFLSRILLEWMTILSRASTTSSEVQAYIRRMRPRVERAVGDPSLLRDYLKGMLIELVAALNADGVSYSLLEKSFADDVAIRALTTKADEAKRNVDVLKARERETFKERMRRLPDAQREITKSLIDLGIAPYLITRDDREAFMRQFQEEVAAAEAAPAAPLPLDVPEEGANADRDVGPQGEAPLDADGNELEDDYGDYGDRRARNADGEEYEEARAFDYDDGPGF